MPRDDRTYLAGRTRGREARDDSRANSPDSPGPAGSRAESSESGDSGPDGPRAQAGRGFNLKLACPGCGKPFSNVSGLRFHRNSRWLTNPACRYAGRIGKRPRILARAATADSDSGPDAPVERLNLMLGVRPDADLPAGAARADPPIQPRDRVSDESAAESGFSAGTRALRPGAVCSWFYHGLLVV